MPLPTGPGVTFLFTDIEGSTRLEQQVGSEEWAIMVGRHDALLREAIESNGGVVVKTEGDAFFAAFDRPRSAAHAAAAAQRAVAAETWPQTCQLRVRMGLHLGEGRLRHGGAGDAEDYVGIDVNYAARIAAAGNGGQIVLSAPLVEALRDPETAATSSAGAAPAAPIALGDGLLVDDGLRAVKDFEDPRRLYRLVIPNAADDPRRLRTLDPPSNLPGEVTELVGRADEIETLRDLLAQTRILTLTGPGGSGKTRLALGLAKSARDRFPHGTWFVDLAAVREPERLESTMASTLGVHESQDRTLETALHEYLRDREALLLLDNLEQLLPAGADIVATLARAAPQVRLLVTSRELLRISGERGHAVPPLDLEAGVRLFTSRAKALRPDLDLARDANVVRHICERLSGLPLAIELAAARVRLLSPALILERLTSSLDLGGGSRDLPERQRTLRGAIAWSHDLLTEPERRLFRRVGVFAGGWTAELAMAVVDADGDLGVDILDGLESLADKSLVRIEAAGSGDAGATEPRFDLHPLLREFAIERLAEAGERERTEQRHAHAIADLAQRLGPTFFGPDGQTAIRRVDREQHNVRAAVAWALRTGDTATGLRVVAPVWRWFQQRGLLREGRGLLDRLLDEPPADRQLHIDALSAVGGLAYWADDIDASSAAYEVRLRLADETNDPAQKAEAHYDLGFISMVRSDAEALREHEQQAFDLFTAAGLEQGILKSRQALGLGVFLTGDYEGALELEGQNLAAFVAAGAEYLVADSMTFHAGAYFSQGDSETAWRFVRDGLKWFGENDNKSGIARALGMAAIVLLSGGDPELGARAAGATYRVVEENGVMLAPVKVLHLREPRELAIERLGAARAKELMADGAALPVMDVIDEVLAAPSPSGSLRASMGAGPVDAIDGASRH